MTNNYHFSCYRTQQDEGEIIMLESDSNGLKAAIKYLEDNFYVGNLQWAFRACQSANWQKLACFGKRFVARFPRKTAAQQRQQACNQKCGRTSRSRRFFKPQMLHNRNRFGTVHRITMHKNRISAFGGSNEKKSQTRQPPIAVTLSSMTC